MVDLTFFLDFSRLGRAPDFLQILDKSSICVSPIAVVSPGALTAAVMRNTTQFAVSEFRGEIAFVEHLYGHASLSNATAHFDSFEYPCIYHGKCGSRSGDSSL